MNKSDELIHSFEISSINPHKLCLTVREHHTVEQDLLQLTLHGYPPVSSFCRRNLMRGGVCIFVKKDQFKFVSVVCKFPQDITISAT
jgi:hypothetical protein